MKREHSLPSPIIEVRKLVKYYGKSDVPALDGLDMRMTKGEIFTLLGRNGAGKTTFLRIATTQLLPTSGDVTVFGLNVLGDTRCYQKENRDRSSGRKTTLDPKRQGSHRSRAYDERREPFRSVEQSEACP